MTLTIQPFLKYLVKHPVEVAENDMVGFVQ